MVAMAIGWLTRSGLLLKLPWSPFQDVMMRGMVTCCPLVNFAWHSKVVSAFASTSLGQSTDCAGGRGGRSPRNLCTYEASSDWLTVFVPAPTETEHPAMTAAMPQSASATERRALAPLGVPRVASEPCEGRS